MRSDGITEIELPWMEFAENAGLPAVRDAFLQRGLPLTQANGLAFFLADQAARQRLAGDETARRYRNQLRAFGPPTDRDRIRAIPG